MRQLIIARKDLQMSAGKLAAQVSHASMAFLSYTIRNSAVPKASVETGETDRYETLLSIPEDVYEQWFCGIYTKTICEAKNRNHLLNAAAIAEDLGLKENVDFFLIMDNCLTELEPEEIYEKGVGHTLTCIGFRPLPDETAHAISRKYQLYK